VIGPRPVLVMHPDCARHDTGWGHPEHQGRLPAIVAALERATPALLGAITQHHPEHATAETIARVHPPAYVDRIREFAERADREATLLRLDPDTLVSPASWDAARAAVGCVVEGALQVADGVASSAFALARPPGHHAPLARAMGFCLFNSIAIAARAVQAERGVDRVLILDWDVHHGNGTQDIFYDDPSVYYLSLHQSPWYPGTGTTDERGSGRGLGTNRNVTLAAGTPAHEYIESFEHALDDAVAEFSPDMILVSAGFDCMRGDPLGRLLLEPHHLHAMTRMVIDRAHAFAGGRVAVALEGGYAPERVGAGVVDVLRALAGLPPGD
jgi:acetoin utilization deacetylase AcuC-like enzyme